MESIQSSTHRKIKSLVVSGGGAKNDIVAQITADIFNLPVKKTETFESCTIGAAMSGFIAEGVFNSPEEAKSSMVRYVKEFTPNPKAAEKYEDLYKMVYKKLYPKLNKQYGKLKEFSNDEIL
jgi:sugar (pentulose or hexulose) kinase